MRVAVLAVGIRDDDLRPLATNDRDQATHGFVELGAGEAPRVLVLRRVGHAGVAVAEPDHLVVADHFGGGGELAAAHTWQVGADLGRVHRGVEDSARLTTGAAPQNASRPLVVVAGDRSGALRGLVVG